MPLDWDLSKPIAREGRAAFFTPPTGDDEGEQINSITEALLWRTMVIDLGEITEANVTEWRFRLAVWRQAFGVATLQYVSGDRYEREPTADELRRHIGMRTNVPTTSRAAFMKKVAKNLECDIMSDPVRMGADGYSRLAR